MITDWDIFHGSFRDPLHGGPKGPKRSLYADRSTSGRSRGFVEDFVHEHVMLGHGIADAMATEAGQLSRDRSGP